MTEDELRKCLESGLGNGEPVGPADNQGPQQEVQASLLREVLLGRAREEAYSGALHLRNVRVIGDWRMASCQIHPRITMEDCVFEGEIDFRQAQLPDLAFVSCVFEKQVDLSQIHLEWNLDLSRSTLKEGLLLVGAKINGRLMMSRLTVRCRKNSPDSIQAGDLEVAADMLCYRADIEGEVTLRSAKIGGVLAFTEAQIRLPAEVESGTVFWGEGMTLGGGFFCDDMEVTGEARIVDAAISGSFTLMGASLSGRVGISDRVVALRADRLEVTGMVRWLGLQATGLVSLLNATMGGQLSIDEANVKGELMLLGARVALECGLTEAVLDGDGGPALSADRVDIGGGMYCQDLVAKGEVRLPVAKIGAILALNGATVTDDYGRKNGVALYARSLQAMGGISAVAIDAKGLLDFSSAKVDGRFSLRGAKLRQGSQKGIFTFMGSTADELMLGLEEARGGIDLRHASVRTLWDEPGNEAEGLTSLRLEGFQYEILAVPRTAQQRLGWIEHSQGKGYYPGVYAELASAFRRIGHRGDARQVEIEGARRSIQQLPQWRPRWLWNKLLWITTGSGYRNWLAGLWLLVLLAIGSLAFWCGEDTFLPLADHHPDFNPVLYAVDATVPVLEVGQQKAFAATGWLRWMTLFLTVSGYALVTAVIAAAAGLLNPDPPA
ncbi:MAG TPA: hypothetical protein VFZ19_09635 [Solirubrobacterales bacterium]